MAPRPTRSRQSRRAARLDFAGLEIVGALLTPDIVARLAAFEANDQSEESYEILAGLKLRDEIARYYRIAEALWSRFEATRGQSVAASERFILDLLRQCLGFDSIKPQPITRLGEREFPVRHMAGGGRVPIVIAPAPVDGARRSGVDESLPQFGDSSRRRSATLLSQEYLNAEGGACWGLVSDGVTLRLMRDNISLTRPAWIEANLSKIFSEGLFADFSALWLLIHQSRFGKADTAVSDCALERWRERGRTEGVAARDKLRQGVEAALLELGQGFIENSANGALRQALSEGTLSAHAYFEQLLRVIYRLIFLFAAEDRGLLHPTGASEQARRVYAEGYSLARLRERSMRRTAWDRHADAWDGLKATFRALTRGQEQLGLPALSGLFAHGVVPDLENARIENRRLLAAIWRLAWLRPEGQPLTRVNWRDMETEELGSVYESLLELTPRASADSRTFDFAEGDETRGNARKTSGSYYTPDGLVKHLLDSTLDPVLDAAEARNIDDPSAEILKLSIVDPACGSGHFLLGAARRAAARIAKHRSPGAPSQEEFQHALREVVSHCIYGVDRNPMAIELCKVALWIEALEPGKPLTFLDSHIRCGDSLIGVFDINVLRDGIPDDAFKPLPGDEKEAASHYRAKNKRETNERVKVETGLGLTAGQSELSKAFAGLQMRPEDSLEDIETKRRLFDSLMARDGAAWKLKTACDLWTAAWFAPKAEVPTRGHEMAPTSGQVWEYLRGVTLYGPLSAEAERCAQTHRFFHWPVEFPDIIAKGGFDVVIGNPPWERVKLQEEEFFAARAPEIANAKNAATRKKLIAELYEANPNLAAEWDAAVRTAACESAYLRLSGRYPLGGVGDVNTYAVFADLFRQAINDEGRTGLILPIGLVSGFTYREFLGHLLKTKTLVSFYGFENEDLIFPHITNKVKFGVLTLTGPRHPVEQPWFTAHIRQPEEITDPERRYALTIDEIEAINPNTLNLPSFRYAKDAEVTATIHKAASVLVRKHADGRIENRWDVSFTRMFDMANDSSHFLDHQDIRPLIVERHAALAVLKDGRRVYPLYEGKMFWNFDHRYGTYENQTEKQANKGVLPRVTDTKHDDPGYRIEPRYWVDAGLTNNTLREASKKNTWFYAWRDVGPAERTLVGTIIPFTAAGHKAPILISKKEPKQICALVALLSSLVADYCVRQKSNAMTFFVVEQIAVIDPDSLGRTLTWLDAPTQDWLTDRALELCYTNEELSPLATDLDRDHPPFRWRTQRRILLQAEIDAAVLHLYALNRTQAEWLLDSFAVLRKYEERDHGEFRTKRIVLEIYDEMAIAKQTGRAYQTRLNPVPADPSCCHPARAAPIRLSVPALTDGVWARSAQPQRGDTGAALAAILKAMDGPKPIRDVRLAAALVLEPRLLVPLLPQHNAVEWHRLVGSEADSLVGNVTAFASRINAAWGTSVRNHRGNGRLVEDLTRGTWAPGSGLEAVDTAGWPEGRVGFVMETLKSIDLGTAVNSLPDEVQQWIDDAAAA
jgi:N-6 DNA Methylase